MRLDVSKALVAEGNEIPFAGEVHLPDVLMFGEVISFSGPAKLKGAYTSVGESIRLYGNMRFVACAHCSLCLTPVTESYDIPFDALYVLTPNPENPDLYIYDGAWIDPSDMAADAALLALPMQWRCAKTCKGLCSVCGADRNHTLCSCRIEGAGKQPFSVLKPLLVDDESEV